MRGDSPLSTSENRMTLNLRHVSYRDLNGKQQEAFNYQKAAAILADYGYITIKLDSDWQGADFIAQHYSDANFVKVQLKSRLCFYKKYQDKNLYVCFPSAGEWYLFPHDTLLEAVMEASTIGDSASWTGKGGYSYPYVPANLQHLLDPYKLIPAPLPPLVAD